MRNTIALALIFTVAVLSSCKKSQNAPAAASKPADAVQQKLQELAGSGATDCGRPQSQAPGDVQPASDCAMKSAQSKKAFYVAYDLPGMTTALAGDSQGKLYAVQSEANGLVQSTPCPAEIRLAQSGRVTCYAAGSMGGMGTMGGASPHGGMQMPPASGSNPHEGSPTPSHSSPQKPQKQ